MAKTKTAIIHVRIQPTLKARAEKAARLDNRSLTSLLEKLLTDHLETVRATALQRRIPGVYGRQSEHLKQGEKK